MSYSWGDDTEDSGRSERSSGYDYRSARETYKEPSGSSGSGSSSSGSARMRSRPAEEEDRKSHDFRSAKGKTPHPVDRPTVAVRTESTHPLVCCVDHTGSFKTEVAIVLEKLPLLGKEVERYMPKYEICFSLIGDTPPARDEQPLQVRDFAQGEALDAHIKALFPEGQGGDDPESYDLAAYYFTKHCEMPNAVKPLFIWVLDSDTRTVLKKKDIKRYIGDDAQEDLDSVEVLKQLATKFTVYVILKRSHAYRSFWANIYGEQHIIPMEEPRDIVELIIGIVAGEAGEYEDFEKRSSKRHSDRPDRVSRVMKSTASVKAKSAATDAGDGMKAETKSGKGGGKSMRSRKLA